MVDLARQLMSLVDRSAMITAFMACTAATPASPHPCGLITVKTSFALPPLDRAAPQNHQYLLCSG
jgi:hypothetical protein